MAKTILYLHGFNSTGASTKAEDMRQRALKFGWTVLSPTIDYKNFDNIPKQLKSLMLTKRPDLVVGTSMGGFLTMYATWKYGVKGIAINPVTEPQETLKKMVGENKNFVTKAKFIFTEQDRLKYAQFVEDEFCHIDVDDRTTFLLALDDELLGDHHYLESKYPNCHNFFYYDGVQHRFGSVKTIMNHITRILQ